MEPPIHHGLVTTTHTATNNSVHAYAQVSGSLIERVAGAEHQWRSKHLMRKESIDFNLQMDTNPLLCEVERMTLMKPRGETRAFALLPYG